VTTGWFEHGTSRIYYEDMGSGDPVLFVPGFSESIETHRTLCAALVAAGYRVLAADPPGSGRSLPQPRAYTASYYEDDARAFSALLRSKGIDSAHVVGFSDGGEYALLMAELSPGLVRSVVAWGAMGRIADPSGQLLPAMYNVVDHPIPPMQGYREFLVGFYGEANARAMTQSAASAFRAIVDERGGDLSLARADTIACPVFLIRGEHDFFVLSPLLAELAARIPQAQVLEVEGAGHDTHNARPEWFAQTVVDWVKQQDNRA
jgi:valacyclovir hydrolase